MRNGGAVRLANALRPAYGRRGCSGLGETEMTDSELREQVDELFLLQRVAQRISALLELDLLLEEIVGDVSQTFGYSRSAVLLKDDATNELVIAAVRGWTVNYHQKGERFKVGGYGIVGHAAATGEPTTRRMCGSIRITN